MEVTYSIIAYPNIVYPNGKESGRSKEFVSSIYPSWNDIFSHIAPALINEARSQILRSELVKYFTSLVNDYYSGSDELSNYSIKKINFFDNEIDTCIIQLRALGLITQGIKKRSIKDTFTYWALTPYGDKLMVQLRTLRRIPVDLEVS